MKPAVLVAAVLAGAYLMHLSANTAAAAADDGATVLDNLDVWGAISNQTDRYNVSSDMSETNVKAFLAMISASEGTNRGDPYRVCYGYRHTIRDLADHPAITGEWSGESIANLGPKYAGMVSTAAGRYQIIRATWISARRALGLKDFGPASQDAAACWLIRNRGAMGDVRAGRIAEAVTKCRSEWASLPGAGYGQPERKLSTLLDVYAAQGGALA